jgi:hypothetical protein
MTPKGIRMIKNTRRVALKRRLTDSSGEAVKSSQPRLCDCATVNLMIISAMK